MQWHVHGTDAGTGQPVTLAVEHPQAMGAVQAAMSKRILVSYVIEGSQLKWLALAAIGVLALAFAGLYWKHCADRADLQAAQAETTRLGATVAESQGTIATLQQRIATFEQSNSGEGRELLDQLNAARQRATATEKDLAASKTRLAELERNASVAAGLQKEAAAAKAQAAQLDQQLRQQTARLHELTAQAQATAALAKTNKALAAELDSLKSQLLIQAAQSQTPAIAASNPTENRATQWALRTTYDAASDFVALQFAGQGLATVPGPQGTAITTAVLTANAATIRLVHDAAKQRVYSVTLTVTLAADAPKEKRAENLRLVQDFLRTFSPGVPESWAADAIKELAAKEPADRMVRVGDDYRLSAWNNGQSTYSWRIESPRGDVE